MSVSIFSKKSQVVHRVRPAERAGTQSPDVVDWDQNPTVYDVVGPPRERTGTPVQKRGMGGSLSKGHHVSQQGTHHVHRVVIVSTEGVLAFRCKVEKGGLWSTSYDCYILLVSSTSVSGLLSKPNTTIPFSYQLKFDIPSTPSKVICCFPESGFEQSDWTTRTITRKMESNAT